MALTKSFKEKSWGKQIGSRRHKSRGKGSHGTDFLLVAAELLYTRAGFRRSRPR